MRKIFIVLLALLLSQEVLFAQDTGEESWRPDPGNILVEVTANPFNSSSFLSLSFGQFRAKYFLTEQLVPRLGVVLSMQNTQNTPDLVTNSSGFTLYPGLEYHLVNEGKFSSYAAADLIIGQRAASSKSTNGPTINGATYYGGSSSSNFGSRGFFQYGLQLGAGADYYLNSRFYFGVEIGAQLLSTKYNDIHVDGELVQQSTVSKSGKINIANTFKVGFHLF
ncbi:MAG: hypothetical protein JXQ96_07690 [Cyclobacteriaceae bacterium]